MNRLFSRGGAFALSSALCLVSVGRLSAQTTAASAPVKPAEEETIVLSPFVVEASEDQGYTAKDTLAGTRVRTELKDVASAISVVTAQFLKDTGAKNSADLLVYTPSTEVGGIRGNFSGVAGGGIYQENTITSTTRVRGLDSADNTRDYFLTDIPWDGFNVGRVDLQRGPNSILFGIGSPAGIINTSVNDASFKTAYNYENRVDTYGSLRNSVSLNQELIKNVLAIRVAAVKDDELYEQTPAYNNSSRFYGALRLDPKLFGDSNHTSIKVKYEDGKINSNNPRAIPPGDSVTRWFGTGADKYGNPGFNKIIINQFNTAQVTPWGTYAASKGGTLANGLALSNQTRSYWPDVINYYEATPMNLNSLASPTVPSSTPTKTITAGVNTGLAVPNSFGGAVNAQFLPLGIPMNTAYYPLAGATSGFPGFSGTNGQSSVPGAIFYANSVLQDPSIFNFYKDLGDGPNKHEWQKWHALNVSLEQTFFNDRLAFQLAFDHQDYLAGAEQFMAGENYNINIDINATYADGTPNPNVGRPYFGNGASAPGLNYQNQTIRDTVRFTPTYDLHFEDFLGKNRLGKILGHHVFTGVFEHSTVKQEYTNWARFATTPDYITSNSNNSNAADTLNSNRSFEWIAYIGPSLLSKSSASGAHLQRLNYVIAPPRQQAVINYNSTWRANPIPGTTGYVNPNATAVPSNTPVAGYVQVGGSGGLYYDPAGYYAAGHSPADANAAYAADPTKPLIPIYSFINYSTGATVNANQLANPANYVGWSQQQITWMDSHNASDYPSLVQGANRTRFRDISRGFTWQGYLLDGDLVPTVGWRKDVITNYQTNAAKDQFSGFTSLNYDDDVTSRTDVRGESKSWGGVYHLPKSLMAKLPLGTTLSVFYDRSRNFKADATRLDLNGKPIPNAIGNTKEYGFTLTTLNEKLSLKIDWFKTKVANATLSGTEGNSIGGLGQNGYFLADGSIWGYGWATILQRGLDGEAVSAGLDTTWNYALADGLPNNTPAEQAAFNLYNHKGGTFTDGTGRTHNYVGGDAIVAAWLNAPFAPGFFKSFRLSPDIDPSIGTRTGKLKDSYYNGGAPTANFLVGGGSSFGNHQTTVDNLSQGTEYELSYQPVKNWNITVNYVHIDATHENIDPVSSEFIGRMTKFFNGPGGQLREWGNGDGNQIQNQWNGSIVGPYTVLLNELGHAAPEVSPWRLNLVSTYNFDHGFAKGFFVGGAFRMEAGRIIGYQYDPTFKNANSDDPNYANVTAVTLGGLNVNKPFIGERDTHLDAWIGYKRKLTRKVDWRVQLNVRSVGESDKLVAGRINPDGSIALARIQQGAGYQLTNSFDF